MSGCRIGKVAMKNGGATVHVLPNRSRTFFHASIENAAKCLDEDTHAFGFFVLSKQGEVSAGVSHGDYFTASQLKGACDHMKDMLMDQVWGCDE